MAAPGGLIWAQVPLVGPTGWAASISCARAPYETTMALLGPPKGPVLSQKGPFGGPGGPWTLPVGSPGGPDLGPTATGWSIIRAPASYRVVHLVIFIIVIVIVVISVGAKLCHTKNHLSDILNPNLEQNLSKIVFAC